MFKLTHRHLLVWVVAALPATVLVLPAVAGPATTVAAVPRSVVQYTAPAGAWLGARELSEQTSGQANDLKARPALWDWTKPVTVPSPIAQTPAVPPTSTAQTLPADEGGDILDEVSVTATRRVVRQRDTTATTYTVKKEDFRAVGASTVADGLQLVPGLIAAPALGGVRGIGNTFLRGFNDQRFGALRDGLSVTRSSNGRSDIFGYQAEDIERIEVLTGGATLRYGSGSVGGVINLITETPKGPPKLTLAYELGSYGFSRYVAKYGGGDDILSYNFTYAGIVAANDYNYSYTLPNSAKFYGTTSNPNARLPGAITTGNQYPNTGTNGRNSFNLSGAGTNDPANFGPIDLYGFIKPEVGPPITVSGNLGSVAGAASDSYSGKLTFRPDPTNRVTLRLNAQNRKYIAGGPGTYSDAVCRGQFSTGGNSVLAGSGRISPVDVNGNPLPCDPQRYIVLTPSTTQALGVGIFPFNRTLDGRLFEAGQAYPFENPSISNTNVQQTNTSQTEVAVFWDYDVNPTTSINSYAYYYRLTGATYVIDPYPYNTNLQQAFGLARIPGLPGQRVPAAIAQPYFQSDKIEFQTSYNTKLSPGQDLSFGINFLEDRSYQRQIAQAGLNPSTPFFDKAIARYSFFLIDDINFSEAFKANAGLRYTSSSQFGELISPAAGFRFSPTRWISFRANWSQVFNAPNLTAINLAGGASLSNQNLKPETGVTYDVGFDLTPVREFGLRFTYFNTYLDGVIGAATFLNPDPTTSAQFPLLTQNVNLDSRLATGLELSADYTPTEQLRLRVSWTNTDARPYGPVDNINQSTFPYFYNFQDPNIPFNNVLVNASYQNRGTLVSLVGRYDSGKRRFNALDFVPSWFTLDLNTEFRLNDLLTLTGSIFNIFDSRYEYLDGQSAPGITFRAGARLEIGG